MAGFRTHVSVGIACGVLSALAITSLALVPESWSFAILVGLAVTLGAQLPDMDSDSGLPFHITFGSLSLVAAALSGLYAWRQYPGDYALIITLPLLTLFAVWVILGSVFKKYTRHRGLMHSIPAAILAALLTFSCATWSDFVDWQAFLLGIGLGLGFLVHLILDEVWAGLNFHGHLFVPNKAFGSALKFASHNHRLTAAVYLAIASLIFINFHDFQSMTTHLISTLASAS